MGSIKLPHASGNSVSIAAPQANPASDRTLYLPSDADGTIARTSDRVLQKISTTTISSSVAQVDLSIDATTYKSVWIFVEGLQTDADCNMYARFAVAGTYNTAANYSSMTVKKYASGFDNGTYGGGGQTYAYLTNNVGGDTNESWSAQMRMNLGSEVGYPLMSIETAYKDNSGGLAGNFGSIFYENWSIINGIRLYPSTGNIDTGKITLYGIT